MAAEARPLQIDAAELARLREAGEPVAVLDVREPWETEICSLPDSLLVPMNEVPARLDELPDDRPLVVLCHHGARSLQVTRWLRAQGYEQAVNLSGGIDGWARRIDPAMRTY